MTHIGHEKERCASVGSRYAGGDARACGAQRSGRRKPQSCCWRSGYQSFHDPWVVGALSTWRLERTEGQAAVWTSTETRWQEAAVDLRHGDPKEPAAAQVPICIVDARDGGHADQEQVQ